MSTSKPKIAFYWCASCGGCEEAVVDLAEGILGVVEAVDIVLWPCAMDFKRADVEAMPDGSIVATLLNGAIRSSEQEEMAHVLRRKSQYLIAYGACAHLGGIPSLANQFSREQVLKYVYEEGPTTINPDKTRMIRDAIAAGTSQYGMQTFDQSLYDLYQQGLISYETALENASNPDDFKLRVQGISGTADATRDEMQASGYRG